MSLIGKLQSDQLQALKNGDKVTLETIRYIVSQLKYKQIDAKNELTDETVVALIRRQIKELQEAIVQFEKAGRQDLVLQNQQQIKILQAYLPSEVDDVQLKKLIDEFVEAHMVEFRANPRALTGKIVAALRQHASPERISRMYAEMITR
jgi:uncharacterized protein YqeY